MQHSRCAAAILMMHIYLDNGSEEEGYWGTTFASKNSNAKLQGGPKKSDCFFESL